MTLPILVNESGVIAVLLSMHGIDKSFSGVPALAAASLDVAAGEVMALVGQNGAGKSTLIKILTGAYARDAGTIRLPGQSRRFPLDRREPGGRASPASIRRSTSRPNRSVAENIFLAREPLPFRSPRPPPHARRGARRSSSASISAIDVDRPLGDFGAATRQMVAIARGVTQNARLVIMDEPTSSLDEREVAVLFETIRTLKADGHGESSSSRHRLDELYAVCDRVTIMRDGCTVAVSAMNAISKFELVAHDARQGADGFTAAARRRTRQRTGKSSSTPAASRAGLRVRDVSVSIGKGRIAGLAGLLGSGRTETARLLYAADRRDKGTVGLAGVARYYRRARRSHRRRHRLPVARTARSKASFRK